MHQITASRIYGTMYDRQYIIIMIIYEKSQLNRLVLGSLTLAPIIILGECRTLWGKCEKAIHCGNKLLDS